MIRINKNITAPVILSGAGAAQTVILNAAYSANPASYTSATGVSNKSLTKMPFDNDIYGDATVKQSLIADQHDKCCFCESKFLETSYGDVEHFRPKGAYKKLNARSLTYPGYYWLAYDWNNLLFSCEKCNRSYKRSLFPMQNELTRKPFHNHANLIANEDCLLVNPNLEDPSTFITFKEETPMPIAGSLKGKKTIDAFGLERLNNTRLDYLRMLELALIFADIDPTDDDQLNLAMATFKFSKDQVKEKIVMATNLYNSAAKDTAKFAHCVRSKFPHLPRI
ncbi:MAG: hypothetical protein EOO20_10765 [Chryseobacterium sp.]|nr:MAG: hypothetical protein EOO20_10765 [Chryseobacterium sp.]